MKVRKDFVSNSSSCSFIIRLQTDKDVKDFRKVLDKFDPKETEIMLYQANMLSDFQHCDDIRINHHSHLTADTFVKTIVGEDNDQKDIADFEAIKDCIQNGDKFFDVYEDPDAHLTFGKDFWENLP